jgi:cell shape-determining protein MreC
MEQETTSISEATRITAQNLYELLIQLSNEIERLQKENAELRDLLSSK